MLFNMIPEYVLYTQRQTGHENKVLDPFAKQ